MRKLLTLAILTLLPGLASALDITNVRPSYGPLGATRTDTRCLPGDLLFMTYEIQGLKFDEKTGKASYLTILELFDAKDPSKAIFKKDTPNEVVPQLGGNTMPGDLHVIMGRSQAPGKYHLRLTVYDRLTKEQKSYIHTFELLPQGFGFVGVTAPAVGFPGQHYVLGMALVDMALDAAKKPKVKITMKVTDEQGRPVNQPSTSQFPQDLPESADLAKENFVPLPFPIYLNRAGRYNIEITAVDEIANKSANFRYPLTVLDLTNLVGK